MRKVLIVKLGYSETLDSALSLTTSLGDVLRTTAILHFFKGDEVTWLVDEKARPLLEGNPFIRRIAVYNVENLKGLVKERFDVVVNFEKLPEVCCFVGAFGCAACFGFKTADSTYGSHAGARRLVDLARDVEKRRMNRDCWQKVLIEALGEKWDNQHYILGYKPRSKVKFDIGFNWATGSKWTNKAWPMERWKELERLVRGSYSVSWQEGLDSINDYIDWIHSCRMIVTSDSLGLHLGIVLKKKIVALFGPTSPHETWLYGYGSYLVAESPHGCVPCLQPRCSRGDPCMGRILPQQVKEKIENEFKRPDAA